MDIYLLVFLVVTCPNVLEIELRDPPFIFQVEEF